MSQRDDSENDIWEYKPLEKKRKGSELLSTTKRRCISRKSSRKDEKKRRGERSAAGLTDDSLSSEAHELIQPLPSQLPATTHTPHSDSHEAEGPTTEDHCPICQMPFHILVVQSQRWHVAECLDTPRDKCKECPDGVHCFSTIPNHYKKFSHALLAHSRANSNTATASPSQQTETSLKTSLSRLPGPINDGEENSIFSASQGSAPSLSALSSHSGSPRSNLTRTPPSKLTNGLLLLRSPKPDDLKKKKGWSSSAKRQKSLSSSQESAKEILSTHVQENITSPCEDLPKEELSPEDDEAISYSPLSQVLADTEVNHEFKEVRKVLFNNNASENEDSMILFSDSDDELFAGIIDSTLDDRNMPVKAPSPSTTQLVSVSSLAPANQGAPSIVAQIRDDLSGGKGTCGQSMNNINKASIQSPQSLVLEHLRESLLSSQGQCIQTEKPQADPKVPPSPNSSVPGSKIMPPQKGHKMSGQASGLKQTDIGVFFGLKPLKEKEAESGPKDLDISSTPSEGEKTRNRRQRRDGQRRGKADTTALMSQTTETVNDGSVVGGQGEAGNVGARGWRRSRWSRANAGDGASRPCPFYKKIPGTKFVVDAFSYGEVQGISAYFLTHFHSDHYGGLTKRATFPIYCNRITGNLVKSKLKVAEQYVHILPMNTKVTVEGVGVILLDANHCPGSAMMLFFLPDGQTVLHTGDFRADPSMETYPELLGRRVQTLYLDTTYCSPEYTFPRQEEVISFAANTAFELVTLNPRTLVVCGSYSVGKEKVFLALAEVLGSKVCLSRDKYNTMCCLESEQVKERITTDWKGARVHVLPMMHLTLKKLQDHLARFSSQYDQLVAFKPTGWTFSQRVDSMEEIQPQIGGSVSIFGIPYSEHSSFLELKRFVQWLKPLKIIPTVNVGSWESRKAMQKCFSDWILEAKAKL
ncbi:DNA cross-link repair 1A protein [Cololabis saira]|uniref:DNA cross-link repair 1A protein n=1 Tax=Cololabis saira TaxID=129043 RepID=UPI002AD47B1A|nr:DNA cross-link repair 1A protein [Cololabis saira]